MTEEQRLTDQHIDWLGIEALSRLIRAREISATEVAQAMLRRIERVDPRLHAYARTTSELALAQAADADARLARGESAGPLHGVPIAVKDLCWTVGIPTAAGTMVHRGFMPPVDGTVVRRLREAGAVLLGKRQMTEVQRSSPRHRCTAESLECANVDRGVLQRLGRGRRRRPMPWRNRHRHRRFDPLSVGGQRRDRPEAHLGPGFAPRDIRTRGLDGPPRTHMPQRR